MGSATGQPSSGLPSPRPLHGGTRRISLFPTLRFHVRKASRPPRWQTRHVKQADSPDSTSPTRAMLWWIPVGAGGHLVRHTSRWWELAHAAAERRRPRQLVHAALEVATEGRRFTIEMAPEWSGPRNSDRGVVQTGPVGLLVLGHWRLFRYEVRCWRDGKIPDLNWAIGDPAMLTDLRTFADSLVDCARDVPPLVWGRTVPGTGDMWNSNSLVSWLIVTAGLDPSAVQPPTGSHAPGWKAGIAVAFGGPAIQPTAGTL